MAFYPTPMTSVDLAIIVDNWRLKSYLRNCIVPMPFNCFGIEYEIKAVNSPFFDDLGNLLQDSYSPDRDLNVEFVPATNLGAKYAKGKILLFPNPDTDVPGHIIERLHSCFSIRVGGGSQFNNYDLPEVTAVGLNFNKES